MEKKGAGGDPQEYDAKSGRYVAGGTGTAYVEKTRARQIIQTYEKAHGSIEKKIVKNALGKEEWARYYATIGEIQAGTLRDRTSRGGQRWVIMNTDVLPNGTTTPPRILIDNGSYVSPKVSGMMTFDNDDEMYDFIGDIAR